MLVLQGVGGAVHELQSQSPEFHLTPNQLAPLWTLFIVCLNAKGWCEGVL